MPRPLLLWLLLLPGLFLVPAHPSRAETPEEFFRDRVEPVLRDHCFACHSHASGKMKGGLTLDSRSGWESGGGRGPALIPGDPDQSLLIKAIRRGEAGLRMPPDDPLDPEEAEILVRWVHDGAFDPRTSPPKESPAISTDWWSLRPLVRLAVPHASRAANPVDAFLSEGQRTADRKSVV